MLLWRLLGPALLLLPAACASTAPTTRDVRDVAAGLFPDTTHVVYTPNASGSHVLVEHRPPRSMARPQPGVSYFIYDRAAGRVVVEERALPGSVAWDGDRHVRVRLRPGAVRAEGDGRVSYRVDAATGERTDMR